MSFVNSSLMPKGVEHIDVLLAKRNAIPRVNSSLMPKGVEHQAILLPATA